jgi:two-component system chemotaxis sensor kinase CheA
MTGNPYESLLGEFLMDARERLERVEDALLAVEARSGGWGPELEQVRRDLHTVKGNAGMMGLTALQQLLHAMEDALQTPETRDNIAALLGELDRARATLPGSGDAGPGAPADGGQLPAGAGRSAVDSVRVPFTALDAIIEQVAEAVIARNRLRTLLEAVRAIRAGSVPPAEQWRTLVDQVREAHQGLDATLEGLQDRILGLRMVPLRTVLSSLRRIVSDEARAAEKSVRFDTTGGDTPLDKALLDVASEALGHLVRNAVIHGLETPAVRRAAGKPPDGRLRVTATSDGESVRLEVADDGRGIERGALLDEARRRGLDLTTIRDPFDLLFMAGFSTRHGADLSAGRGIGLAAVHEAVMRQGGWIDVHSVVGEGTRFTLQVPLSVSITRALLLHADGEDYALPLSAVVDSQRFRRGDGHGIHGGWVWRWRDQVIPLTDLGCRCETATTLRQDGYAVVIEYGRKHRALVVDRLRGILEIVVRGLDPITGRPEGFGGTTILGDGRAILILDPRTLVDAAPAPGAAA